MIDSSLTGASSSTPQASGTSPREPSLQRLQDAETLLQSLIDLSQDRAAGDNLWSCLPRPPVKIRSGEKN